MDTFRHAINDLLVWVVWCDDRGFLLMSPAALAALAGS